MSMEYWWNDTNRRTLEVRGEKLVTVSLWPLQILAFTCLGLNLGLQSEGLVVNHLNRGTASWFL